jgi:hypothetical protein
LPVFSTSGMTSEVLACPSVLSNTWGVFTGPGPAEAFIPQTPTHNPENAFKTLANPLHQNPLLLQWLVNPKCRVRLSSPQSDCLLPSFLTYSFFNLFLSLPDFFLWLELTLPKDSHKCCLVS